MAYKAYLMSAVQRIQRDFGGYVPSLFPLELLSRPDVSDGTAYQMAKFWRDVTTNNYRAAQEKAHSRNDSSDNEMLHVKFKPTRDGFEVINTDTFALEAWYTIQPDGLFSYHGPRKYAVNLGGRGELGDVPTKLVQIHKSLKDRDILRD